MLAEGDGLRSVILDDETRAQNHDFGEFVLADPLRPRESNLDFFRLAGLRRYYQPGICGRCFERHHLCKGSITTLPPVPAGIRTCDHIESPTLKVKSLPWSLGCDNTESSSSTFDVVEGAEEAH